MDPRRIWFDPPHVRWGRVMATVLIVTALVGLWVAQRRGLFDDAPERVVPAISPVGSAIAVAAGRAASAPGVAMAAAPAASSAELICGLGQVDFDPSDKEQIEKLARDANEGLQAYRQRVLPGWLEEMKDSADEPTRAIAWFAEAIESWRTKGLKAAEEQNKPWAKTGVRFDGLDELARLADRSSDPKVYALAMSACGLLSDDPATTPCGLLSFAEWARRDPSNGYPWLLAVGQAPKGSAQRSELIERAMASGEVRVPWGLAHALLTKALPATGSRLDRSVVAFEAMALDGIQTMPPIGLMDYCREEELRKGERRTQCDRLAAFLAEKSDSLLLRKFARNIGRNVGWSKDRLDVIERDWQDMAAASPSLDDFGGCESLARTEAYFADVTKYGEIGALRRRLNGTETAAR